MASPTLLLVGGGKMGGALLGGWRDQGIPAEAITVVEPNAELRERIATDHGARGVAGASEIDSGFTPEVAVLAVKPQVMDTVVPAYEPLARAGTVFLSIAAGKPIAAFEGWLGAGAAIVRAMPNTPAAVGKGISVLCANQAVTAAQRETCESLMIAVGAAAWVDDEGLMDAVTAVSGSGPAYVFWLTECLARGGVAAGLPQDLADQLARATVAGAGALMEGAGQDPATLRRNVTSPGGTTAAALEVLMADDGLESLMTRAVNAATRRGRELAK